MVAPSAAPGRARRRPAPAPQTLDMTRATTMQCACCTPASVPESTTVPSPSLGSMFSETPVAFRIRSEDSPPRPRTRPMESFGMGKAIVEGLDMTRSSSVWSVWGMDSSGAAPSSPSTSTSTSASSASSASASASASWAAAAAAASAAAAFSAVPLPCLANCHVPFESIRRLALGGAELLCQGGAGPPMACMAGPPQGGGAAVLLPIPLAGIPLAGITGRGARSWGGGADLQPPPASQPPEPVEPL
mmetsp:Transcript_52728/g.141215  ORF Transcript_52728/g.141215 Transcript_52728/m.141215 type:complete len:246 (+) Transcript_52728:62-799(+)